ncbi:MAG TPA: hypothetical protein VMW19_03875 [Myxococcota bacterium]|nr:hypothetical protein [Myxococcota bacterium]
MSRRFDRWVQSLFAVAALAAPLVAAAQTVDVEEVEPQEPSDHNFALRAGYDHVFESHIKNVGGSNVSIDNFQASIGGRFKLSDSVGFTPRFIYSLGAYDFSDNIRPAGWENINTYTLLGLLDYKMNEHWTLIGGPVFRLSGEGAAAFNNGFTGGGLAGAVWTPNKDLTLGAGLGIMSQIEDDPGLIPIPIVRWHFADPLTFKLGISDLGGRTGLGPELIWNISKEVDLGLGAQYQRRRFRMDDHDGNSKGVGEDTGAPVYARLTFRPMDQLSLEGFAGVLAAGDLTIQDKNGGHTLDKGYQTTPTLGLRGEYRF